MPRPSLNQIRDAYRKHFTATRNMAIAWNLVLDEMVPDSSDFELRKFVGDLIHKIRAQVELEEGDPYELARHAALEALKKDNVLERARKKAAEVERDVKEEIREELKKTLKEKPVGPTEWSPKKKVGSFDEDDLDRAYEKYVESHDEHLSLMVAFDEKGGFYHWELNYPSEWVSYSAPLAVIDTYPYIQWDDIDRGIQEALGQLDWDKIKEELRNPDES